MTISSEVRKAGPFDGNDVADTFPFAFKVFTPADLLVIRADPTGDETVLTMGSDYTVALNPDQNEAPGGSVTLNAPLATGYVLAVTSQVGNLQPVDLTNQGGFYPNVINAALDRATIQIQQLAEEMSRAAKLPITRDEDVDELLNDLVRVADNMDDLNSVVGIAPEIQAVAAIDSEVVTVAGVASSIPAVAAIDSEVVTVAGIASDIPAVAASVANIDAVADDLTNVNVVASNIGSVNATAPEIASVVEVAEHMPDILAALADLPSLAAKVSKTGDTMTGHLSVPAGATGNQVPRASEIFGKGQSLQTVTRISGVTYTNSPGKPITVIAIAEVTGIAPGIVHIEVDGVYADQDWGWELGSTMVINFVVPPGSTYKITGVNASAIFATEYR